MAINPYTQPVQSTDVRQYVPMPMEAIGNAIGARRKAHATNRQVLGKVNSGLGSLDYIPVPGEKEYVDEVVKDYKNQIDGLAKNGPMSQATDIVSDLAKKFQSDPRLKDINRNYETFEKYREEIKNVDPVERQRMLDLSYRNFNSSKDGFFNGVPILENIDEAKFLQETGKDMGFFDTNTDTYKIPFYKRDSEGGFITDSKGQPIIGIKKIKKTSQRLSDKNLYNVLYHSLSTNEDAIQRLNRELDYDGITGEERSAEMNKRISRKVKDLVGKMKPVLNYTEEDDLTPNSFIEKFNPKTEKPTESEEESEEIERDDFYLLNDLIETSVRQKVNLRGGYGSDIQREIDTEQIHNIDGLTNHLIVQNSSKMALDKYTVHTDANGEKYFVDPRQGRVTNSAKIKELKRHKATVAYYQKTMDNILGEINHNIKNNQAYSDIKGIEFDVNKNAANKKVSIEPTKESISQKVIDDYDNIFSNSESVIESNSFKDVTVEKDGKEYTLGIHKIGNNAIYRLKLDDGKYALKLAVSNSADNEDAINEILEQTYEIGIDHYQEKVDQVKTDATNTMMDPDDVTAVQYLLSGYGADTEDAKYEKSEQYKKLTGVLSSMDFADGSIKYDIINNDGKEGKQNEDPSTFVKELIGIDEDGGDNSGFINFDKVIDKVVPRSLVIKNGEIGVRVDMYDKDEELKSGNIVIYSDAIQEMYEPQMGEIQEQTFESQLQRRLGINMPMKIDMGKGNIEESVFDNIENAEFTPKELEENFFLRGSNYSVRAENIPYHLKQRDITITELGIQKLKIARLNNNDYHIVALLNGSLIDNTDEVQVYEGDLKTIDSQVSTNTAQPGVELYRILKQIMQEYSTEFINGYKPSKQQKEN